MRKNSSASLVPASSSRDSGRDTNALTRLRHALTDVRLLSRFVGLDDAELIAFGILACREPSDARYRTFRAHDRSAGIDDFLQRIVDRRHADRYRVRGAGRSRRHSAVDPAFAVRPRRDEPVIEWSGPFVEFPAECARVEFYGALRIVGREIEVHGTCHGGGLSFQ